MDGPGSARAEIWFVYDGDCPLCNTAAHALKIREAVGTLHLLDARCNRDHPLIQQINAKELDLDQGMVIKYGEVFYHGTSALQIMALLGTGRGWFNRMNAILFRTRHLAALSYPLMRFARNMSLRIKGSPQIRNLDS